MSMNYIKILDEDTANKVAAGEVVERPASVVKELVENAIDAGSRRIEVECENGGTTMVRVSDNGHGMSGADAILSVMRHATSKILNIEDLFKLSSMGFRGEALPSIAAVSEFSLETKNEQSVLATEVIVNGGGKPLVSESGRAVGTTVTVRNLFYNVPARKKFLKSATTENSHIVNTLTKIALANPEISILYKNNSKILLNSPGNGNLFDTITALYGKNVAGDLLETNFEQEGVNVHGYIARPSTVRSNRSWQTFCVNKRTINSRVLFKALDNAYHSLLPRHGFVFSVLFIDISPEKIDVNVHPQKQEIKFDNEQLVYAAVYKAVSLALATADTIQSKIPVTNNNYRQPGHQIYLPASGTPNTAAMHINNYLNTSSKNSSEQQTPVTVREVREAFQQDLISKNSITEDYAQKTGLESCSSDNNIFEVQIIGCFDNTYIIASVNNSLCIIDQHAAHERIIYDKLCVEAERLPSQKLLIGEFMDMSAAEIQLAEKHALEIFELGYSFEQASPMTLKITEIPSDMSNKVAVDVFLSILGYFREHHKTTPGQIRHEFLQMAACKAACKSGDILSQTSMYSLITNLLTTAKPYTCPHGRPTILEYSRQDLDRIFKRI